MHGAVDFIAIDVDVGEVVIRADFLNLPQGVLKCAPVPQADVLEGGSIVCGIGRVNSGRSGKFALREAVQS